MTIDAAPDRWALNRAGILNVYQYEDETIDFHGGRLLLRGVNGSGKSTAMNMLLPFLVTARQTRIDAAGEQTGVLKSWMLSGHDDPQPVGYLWIEFAARDRYLACGCGIKANRQSDTVNTWWFVTERRPGIDFELVDNKVPLSADALRATLGDDADVFAHDRRRDYRQLIQRRLFGGADIEQHVKLLNVVRNPRIGDRIDVELPAHLVDALPQLSERALADAAQPLDDLEAHRRHVAELEQTRDAIEGLLAVYRPYCRTELARRVADADRTLGARRERLADERRAADVRDAAARHFAEVQRALHGIESEVERLEGEQRALEASDAYKSSATLNDLREHAATAASAVETGERDVERANERVESVASAVERATVVADDDRAQLDAALDALVADLAAVHVGTDPLPPLDLDAAEPFRVALASWSAALRQRRADLDDVREQRSNVDRAEQQLGAEQLAATRAAEQHAAAIETLRTREAGVRAARDAWFEDATAWSTEHQIEPSGPDAEPTDVFERSRALERLLTERLDAAHAERGDAVARHDVAATAADDARTTVEELAQQTEPEMPPLPWQRDEPVRLADLIDFRDGLSDAERAGLEGALAASGLLHATVGADGATLASGELVATGDGPETDAPLARLLTVTIPERVDDVTAGDVERLLAAISTDPSAAGSTHTVIATDGEFLIGRLQGRYTKPQAEYIGRSARQAALERARAEAAAALADAEQSLADAAAALERADTAISAYRAAHDSLPSLDPVRTADAAAASAHEYERTAAAALDDAEERRATAEQRLVALDDELRRVAATLRIPADTDGLVEFERSLDDVATQQQNAVHLLRQAARSHAGAGRERDHHTAANAEAERIAAVLIDLRAKHEQLAAKLATLEDSIGAEVEQVLADLEQVATDLRIAKARRAELHTAELEANTERERAANAADAAVADREAAEATCETSRAELATVIDLPGVVEAAVARLPDDPDPSDDAAGSKPAGVTGVPTTSALTGADGLAKLVERLRERLPERAAPPAEPVDAESVRMSLRQRRDAIGSGWDAEARQPDPTRPLLISIHGPSGRGTLVEQRAAIVAKHAETSNLLTRKQDDALRGLLQGLIAKELSEKIDAASRLIELMNERLGQVRTAHDVGVELRWRRSAELDESTARLTELLAMVPSLRRPDDDAELRTLLAHRLDAARREQPDVPYRQLLAGTLDYRGWHELVVLLHRGGSQATRLKRSTPLSEGEKKLVTYLPMFAAVAASCDALAETATDDDDDPAPSRFVLLDDAFAKVSEDNHAALFGLIVGLDLDLIATSERLWGTHASVPSLAITEVIRNASIGAILLEHYLWDGAALERVG